MTDGIGLDWIEREREYKGDGAYIVSALNQSGQAQMTSSATANKPTLAPCAWIESLTMLPDSTGGSGSSI